MSYLDTLWNLKQTVPSCGSWDLKKSYIWASWTNSTSGIYCVSWKNDWREPSQLECSSGRVFLSVSNRVRERSNRARTVSNSHSLFYIWNRTETDTASFTWDCVTHLLLLWLPPVGRSYKCVALLHKLQAPRMNRKENRILFISALHFHQKLAESDPNLNGISTYLIYLVRPVRYRQVPSCAALVSTL